MVILHHPIQVFHLDQVVFLYHLKRGMVIKPAKGSTLARPTHLTAPINIIEVMSLHPRDPLLPLSHPHLRILSLHYLPPNLLLHLAHDVHQKIWIWTYIPLMMNHRLNRNLPHSRVLIRLISKMVLHRRLSSARGLILLSMLLHLESRPLLKILYQVQ